MKNLRAYTGYDAEAVSFETGLDCSSDPSKTVQAGRDDADINVIVRRFGVTGMMPQKVVAPTFQDFEGIFDFQSAMNAVVYAERQFMQMDGDVRKRFGNDPQEFVAFCSDEKNLPELLKMGLVIENKPVEPAPIAVRVVGDAPPA